MATTFSDCYGGAAFTLEDRATMVHQVALCATGGIPAAPQVEGDVDLLPIEKEPDCCKLCRTSQACGDSCIAFTKTCTKEPGCACQGP